MSKEYLAEIHEQPEIIGLLPESFSANNNLAEIEKVRISISTGKIRHVVLTGMGGSLYSAYGLWQGLTRHLSIPISYWDTSELIQQCPKIIAEDVLVIAISQSGESAELQKLTKLSNSPGASISVTNRTGNTLSEWASISITTNAGPERTASTKTYTSGMLALRLIEAALLGDFPQFAQRARRLSDNIKVVLSLAGESVEQMVQFLGHSYPLTFIGRGNSYSSAAMAALLTQEAAKLHTAAHTGGQFRHGPLELVRENFRSIVFLGNDSTSELTRKTVGDITKFGGRCLVIAPANSGMVNSDNVQVFFLPSELQELYPVLEILPIQLLMIPLAIARDFEPAAFLNASKITSEE